MLTKSQIKLITSLKQKKFRIQHQLFVVEGVKVVQEFLNSNYELVAIFAVEDRYSQYNQKFTLVDSKELAKISGFSTPNKVLATFKIPSPLTVNWSFLTVALDGINDPGNLGTIIRLCDWFGIKDLICKTETVDCYNPKVIQATMGSITRVKVNYVNLNDYISQSSLPVFGTFMDGKNLYKEVLPKESCQESSQAVQLARNSIRSAEDWATGD